MSSNTPELFLPPDKFPRTSDYTVYLPARKSEDQDKDDVEKVIDQLPVGQKEFPKYSVDCSIRMKDKSDPQDDGLRGRIIACRCFRREQWSVTIRLETEPPLRPGLGAGGVDSNFKPDSERAGFLCSRAETCGAIYDQIFVQPQRSGLIVVTGATASGKSEVARGIIYKRMENAVRHMQERAKNEKQVRRPHLITFEDPIEKFYRKDSDREQPPDFDYTPRQKDVDASDLRSVLKDALRQTPELVFVGEIRDSVDDWAAVVDFAATGHSIIATAHAGSLAEAWGRILKGARAKSPPERSDVADRVLGIIHLRSFPDVRGAVPAIWRYTLAGAKALAAEGRGSLVPVRGLWSGDQQEENWKLENSSLGRVWFLQHLKTRCGCAVQGGLEKAAINSDLEGI